MKAQTPLFVRRIWQVDNDRFAIAWQDGVVQLFHLKTLQELCPCAACTTSREKKASSSTSEKVSCSSIQNVGRYALRIHYTTGCAHGIYSFSYLKNLGTSFIENEIKK